MVAAACRWRRECLDPTHAFFGSRYDFDAIVVLSPMSVERSKTVIGAVSRLVARPSLASELRTANRVPVTVLAPTGELAALVSDGALNSLNTNAIAKRTFDYVSSLTRERRAQRRNALSLDPPIGWVWGGSRIRVKDPLGWDDEGLLHRQHPNHRRHFQ